MLDFFADHFPAQPRELWRARMRRGEVVDEHGRCVDADQAYQASLRVYYYRSVEAEPRIPFEEALLYRDAHLLVVDKPHFLPVVPSGGYLQETLLVRLKRRLGIDTLVPLHRIDRDTAGVVLFSVQPSSRGAYSALFRDHRIRKLYHAIAPWRAALRLPLTRTSRIGPGPHFMQQQELPGPANSTTHVRLLQARDGWGLYELEPVSGHRHQLRVHMQALGIPIRGDGIYPRLLPQGPADYLDPLQLLARSVEFTDPLSGQAHRFESPRRLTLAS